MSVCDKNPFFKLTLNVSNHLIHNGLNSAVLAAIKKIEKKFSKGSFRGICLIDYLCKTEGCQTQIDSPDALNLLVMDYGHLTLAASDYVV